MFLSPSVNFLFNEARSLLTRLDQVKAFSLTMPMVPAATISPEALTAIDRFLMKGRSEIRFLINNYIEWLNENMHMPSFEMEAQRKFAILRLRFNDVLSQVDIFADVLNQRSEHDIGVRISALDVAASDALSLPGNYYETPPVICYIDRGHGAAIRRARTRLPGGKDNPVAVIRVPREHMIGSGIASSLFHEVGHQGAALLDLVNSLRPALQSAGERINTQINPWMLWQRWVSEIVADFWSVSKLGIGATLGLIGVVSLPRAFVFRINLDDPHPFPWIRVKLSCAMGNALYPHPQWQKLCSLWESLYPLEGLSVDRRQVISALLKGIPDFIALLMNHRPKSLHGESLGSIFSFADRTPVRLQTKLMEWNVSPDRMLEAPPSQAFAVIGQGKSNNKITPEKESLILSDLLKHWALKSTINISEINSRRLTQSPTKVNNLILV